MKQSFLLKPLLFKEWKEHRWWIVAAFALSLYMPYANLLALLQSSSTSGNANVLWRVLVPALYGLHYTPSDGNYPVSYVIHGGPAVSGMLVIVAMGLMIALITVERNRGSVWYTASFPIRRKDALRVKVFLGLTTVLSALILDFLLLLVCDFISGHAVPTAVLLQWMGQNLLFILVMMALGLLTATVFQAGAAAGLAALLLSAFPWAVGLSVLRAAHLNGVGFATGSTPNLLSVSQPQHLSTAGNISQAFRALSPMVYLSGTTGYGGSSSGLNQPFYMTIQTGHSLGVGVSLWFVFWTIICGLIAYRAYLNAPLEYTSSFVQFPRILPWFLWGVYGAMSFFLVNATTASKTQLSHTPYVVLVYWIAAWLAIGLLATLLFAILRVRSRSRLEP